MLRFLNTLILLFTFISASLFSQSPEGINYQAIMRDSSGIILSNQNISLKISITLPPPSSTLEYAETHNVTTDNLGLVNVVIGQGTYTGGSLSTFSALDWSQNQYWIMLDMDPNAGTSYTSMGHQQLMSVPYALYAQSSGGTIGTTGAQGQTGPSGTDGTPGSKGATGPQGSAGIQGASGPTGTDGINGTQGATGPSGTDGSAGTQGATGPSGTDGTNGVDGTNGSNGVTGPQGPTGVAGTYTVGNDIIINGTTISVEDDIDASVVRATTQQGLALVDDAGQGMIIADGGMVGVGTINPDAALHIKNNIIPQLRVEPSDDHSRDARVEIIGHRNGATTLDQAQLQFRNFDNDSPGFNAGLNSLAMISGQVTNATTNVGDLVFHNYSDGLNQSETMRLTSDNDVGIGTPTPENKLHVYDSGQGGDLIIENQTPWIYLTSNSGGGANKGIQYKQGTTLEFDSYYKGASATYVMDHKGDTGVEFEINTTGIKAENGTSVNEFSTDGTFADNSDDALPTEKAVKTYVDNTSGNGKWMIDSSSVPYNIYSSVAGNVGVGTSSPQAKLHVSGGDQRLDGQLKFGDIAHMTFESTTIWGNYYENLKISSGGNNAGPTSASGYFSGGVGISSTHSNYWVKSQLHVNDRHAGTASPSPVLKVLTISATSANGTDLNAGDGVALDFELPMVTQNSESRLGGSIELVKASDTDNNSSGRMILSTTSNDEIKNNALTIDSNGYIGINNTDPNSRLVVSDYGSQIISNSDTFIANIHGYHNSGLLVHTGYNDGVDIARFSSIGSGYVEVPRLVIKDNGNVGIGTSSPLDKLHIYSDDSVNSRGITIHSKRYARMHIKSDNYWAGIELRRDSSGEAGRPHIDFTNNYTDNYGIRVSASNDSTLNIEGGNLDITKQIKIRGGIPGNGKVLTSDANGLASWQNGNISGMEFTGNELLNAVIHGEEQHWATIELSGTFANSVFQGFVYDNKNNFLYTSHKSSVLPGEIAGVYVDGTEETTITKYEFDSDGSPDIVSTSNQIHVGHSQDLSIEYLNENDFRLWTSNENGDGASRINYNGSSTTFTSYSLLPSGYSSSTPTVSTNGKYLVIRGYSSSINRIFVYSLSDVINSSGGTGVSSIYEFDTHTDQNNSSTMKFQGILCDNDIIYCLTGYNQTTVNKLLYAYTLDGEILSKKELTTGKSWAISEGSKWEPEGLAIYQPHPNIKTLLVGICASDSGPTDFDNKRIYSIGLGSGIWTINGDKHPSDLGLHFSGGSRDINYLPTHALQFGQWDPDNLSYTERMRLNSSGALAIGTTDPLGMKFYVSGSVGGTTGWNTSDQRYKEKINIIDNALKKLIGLRGVSYTWKDGDATESKGFDDRKHYGVIAQEVEKQFPELIDHPGNTDKFKHVEYNGFVGIFIEAIKEQQKQLDKQSKMIMNLTNEIKLLKLERKTE